MPRPLTRRSISLHQHTARRVVDFNSALRRWRLSSIAAVVTSGLPQLCEVLARLHPIEPNLVVQQLHPKGMVHCRRGAWHASHPSAGYTGRFVNSQERPGIGATRVAQATDRALTSRNSARRVRHHGCMAPARGPALPLERLHRLSWRHGNLPTCLYCVTQQAMKYCLGLHARSQEYVPSSEATRSRVRCCRHLPL